MVARINTSKCVSKALNYNEQKLQQGNAEILDAVNFLKDAPHLNFQDKLRHFERHTSLNERTTTNTLHVSLSFDMSEQISNEQMKDIAKDYMGSIGFGAQPFLVYRHHDAAHPHLHIVSININTNGDRISMHNIGRNQSERARKAIEIEYTLVKASDKKLSEAQQLAPVNAQKIQYGKSETKRAISNVLLVVMSQYKFKSLPELNAVLGLYNVTADRGSKASRTFANNGLVYRVLDEQGKKVSCPIKASSFYMKPTLANLEKKFTENEMAAEPFKKKLQTSIGWILQQQPSSFNAFKRELEKENISLVLRTGKDNILYGLTYVDHKNKVVFNGSDLGKAYSAKAVQKLLQPAIKVEFTPHNQHLKIDSKTQEQAGSNPILPKNGTAQGQQGHFNILAPAQAAEAYLPNLLLKKKKKKRKRLSL